MVYALYFSDRRVKAKRKNELRKLLYGPELEVFSETPGAHLENYSPEFTQELESQMARNPCYLFAQEPHKGRLVAYPERGYDPDRPAEPCQTPAEEVTSELVFETVRQWESTVTFALTNSEANSEADSETDSETDSDEDPGRGKNLQKFFVELKAKPSK